MPSRQVYDANGHLITIFRFGAHQSVAYTGTHGVITNAIADGVTVAMIYASTDAHFAVSAAPTAVATNACIPAGTVLFIPVQPGDKVSFLQFATGGTGHVTECL